MVRSSRTAAARRAADQKLALNSAELRRARMVAIRSLTEVALSLEAPLPCWVSSSTPANVTADAKYDHIDGLIQGLTRDFGSSAGDLRESIQMARVCLGYDFRVTTALDRVEEVLTLLVARQAIAAEIR